MTLFRKRVGLALCVLTVATMGGVSSAFVVDSRLFREQVSLYSYKTKADETGTGLEDNKRDTAAIRSLPTLGEESKSPALRQFQDLASPVAKSFVPTAFNPHPLLTNCHLQTIGGVFLRNQPGFAYIREQDGLGSAMESIFSVATSLASKKQSEAECAFWDERERIDTPDGDFFHVDYKYCADRTAARGTLVLMHGLESNSNSSLSIDIAKAHCNLGFNVACLNSRGCSGVPNNRMGMYHAGFTQDLKHLLGVLKDRNDRDRQQATIDSSSFPEHPIYLSGFSLGANTVLKALGELGETARTVYNIRGASVTGAPFDMERNIQFVDAPGFNRIVYAGNFLNTMKQKCQAKLEEYCDNDPNTKLFNYKRVMEADTIAEVENGWLAPVHGFKDNIDYYRQVSCGYFLDGIAVPTFILNAGDDPFFDPSYFPLEKSVDGGGAAPIKMVRTKHGGHLGFLFHRLAKDGTTEHYIGSAASWMPTELARFVDHVDKYATA